MQLALTHEGFRTIIRNLILQVTDTFRSVRLSWVGMVSKTFHWCPKYSYFQNITIYHISSLLSSRCATFRNRRLRKYFFFLV